MSVKLIKSIGINPVSKTISVTSAYNNITPRRYETWNPLASSHFTFETWLDAFASDCFGGSAQFLPSCESKAHEAYLWACIAMGGDWSYAYNTFGEMDGPEYTEFERKWCKEFVSFCLYGKHDTRRYIMTRNNRPVNLSVRKGRYGGLFGHYCYVDDPKRAKTVSWIKHKNRGF